MTMIDKLTVLKRLAAGLRHIPFLPREARDIVDLIVDLLDDLVHVINHQVPAVKDSGAANAN